jgi:glutamyl/glutaminyl-tRNA synthetase
MKINTIDEVKKSIEIGLWVLESVDNLENIDELKDKFIVAIKENEMKNGQVLWPIRVSLSCEKFSPWAFELIYILWIEESKKRMKKVLQEL